MNNDQPYVEVQIQSNPTTLFPLKSNFPTSHEVSKKQDRAIDRSCYSMLRGYEIEICL